MRQNRLYKKWIVFTLIFLSLLLAACEKGQGVSDFLDQSNGGDNPDVEENDPPVEGAIDEGNHSSENKLVWYVDASTVPEANVDGAIYSRFNELLQEKGADYTVEFTLEQLQLASRGIIKSTAQSKGSLEILTFIVY